MMQEERFSWGKFLNVLRDCWCSLGPAWQGACGETCKQIPVLDRAQRGLAGCGEEPSPPLAQGP